MTEEEDTPFDTSVAAPQLPPMFPNAPHALPTPLGQPQFHSSGVKPTHERGSERWWEVMDEERYDVFSDKEDR